MGLHDRVEKKFAVEYFSAGDVGNAGPSGLLRTFTARPGQNVIEKCLRAARAIPLQCVCHSLIISGQSAHQDDSALGFQYQIYYRHSGIFL